MPVVSVRLSEPAAARYQALADQAWPRPISLSAYLKLRLEEGDAIAENIASLRLDLAALADRLAADTGQARAGPAGTENVALVLETLLLLRRLTKPEILKSVHTDMKRLGFDAFTGQ